MSKHNIKFVYLSLLQFLTVLTVYIVSTCPIDSHLAAQDFAIEATKPNEVKKTKPRSTPKPLNRSTKSKTEINRDPIVKLAEKRFADLKQEWNNWDQNQDSKLDQVEFSQSTITQTIPGLSHTKWIDWDRNQDNFVDLTDCQKVIDVAYAIRHPSGVRLRSETGRVVNWYYYKYLDTNADSLITLKELQKKGYDGNQAQARFQKADADQNGKLTLAEWVTGSYRWIDPGKTFLQKDKNQDGQIDQTELLTSTSKWELPVAKFYFPGFDIDRNGKLSLNEFLDSPLAVPIVRWPVPRQDTNQDGYLTVDEFRWESGILQSAILAEYFQRLDVNHDHKLSLHEFFFNTNKRSPEGDFQRHDLDHNELLTEQEFLKLFNTQKQQFGKQQFAIFDFNEDHKLTFSEYMRIPSLVSADKRGELPSPTTELIKKHMQLIEKSWPQFDKDQNGLVDYQEFQPSILGRSIPVIPMFIIQNWDRNHDGNITQAECQSFLEIAYGIRLPNGTKIRNNSGLILNWIYFKHVDKDQNNKISLEELTKFGYDGKQAKDRFQKADTDHNSEIIFAEWLTMPVRWIDPAITYQKLDQNLDGRVDQQELLAKTSAWELPIAKHYFPSFDTNNDKRLSLIEFADSPLANPIFRWPVPLQDLNTNGYLELSEFKWEQGIFATGLLKEYFNRLDTNKDNRLDLDEFTYRIHPHKTPRYIIFMSKDVDKNGKLTLEELLDKTTSGVTTNAKTEQQALVEIIETAFHRSDKNGDQALNQREFQSKAALGIIDPDLVQRERDLAREYATQSPTYNPQKTQTMWMTLGFNVILLTGVLIFIIRKISLSKSRPK